MRAAERWAKSQGAVDLLLDCHAANLWAIRFYEKLGTVSEGSFLPSPGPLRIINCQVEADRAESALPEPGQMDRDRRDERAVVSMRELTPRVRS
jgi:hypothetical protein